MPNSIHHVGLRVWQQQRQSLSAAINWRAISAFLDCRRFGMPQSTACKSPVASRSRISSVGSDANKALIDAAIAAKADAIIVHHGLFWKGDS